MAIFDYLGSGLSPWYWGTMGTSDLSTQGWCQIERVKNKVEVVDMSNMSPDDAKKRIFGSITSEEFDNKTY